MMPSNYEVLEDAINHLPTPLRSHIIEIPIENGKKLFLISNRYEGLPQQLKLHYNRLDIELNEEIVNEMNQNKEFKVFCCIDFQDIINIMTDMSRFRKVFRSSMPQNVFNQINSKFYEDYEDLETKKASLKIIKSFGFSRYNNTAIERVAEEPYCKLYSILCDYYYRNSNDLMDKGFRFNFIQNIIEPFHKLISIISKEDCIITDNRNYSFIDTDKISDATIQNLFICMQFHTFFEDFVVSKFPAGSSIIKNPLVLINPTVKGNGTIDGYFELDGAFVIDSDKKISFVESKNSRLIKIEHLTHLIGKTNLIERVYDLNVKKMIFSTGERHWLWKDIESKYGKMDDIKLFDLNNFRNGFVGV